MELTNSTFPLDERHLKKHIEVVHTHGHLSLFENRLWNELLANAYPNLLTQSRHHFKYSVLVERLKYNSGDRNLIKSSLKKLARTQIEFINSDDSGKELSWEVKNYISAPKIVWGKDGFDYGFDHGLPELLHDPDTYALISQSSEERFNSKYSLYLYENCVRYKARPGYPGLTPLWLLGVLHKFMGTEGIELYERFAELNRRVLKPAIKEINEKSDIHLTFLPAKQARKIIGAQFRVIDNPKNNQLKIPGTEEQKQTAEILKKTIVQQCIKIGASQGVACLWYKQFGEAYLSEKILFTEKTIKAGKIKKTPGACLTWAVDNDIKDNNPLLEAGKKRLTKNLETAQIQKVEQEKTDAKMDKERNARKQAREDVETYWIERTENKKQELQEEFESKYNDFISSSIFKRQEIFHCWLAEKAKIGNPYPMIRGPRLKHLSAEKVIISQ